MWRRSNKAGSRTPEAPNVLKNAVREARIEAAERSAVVVDLRDAEVARLELLDEALDPVFKDIPAGVELFDRGVSKGSVARLWVDAIIDPALTREALIWALEAAALNPEIADFKTGVLQT